MKEYTFTMTRTERGDVTVTADNYSEAKQKAYDYTRRIVLVNNLPWYQLRTIDHELKTQLDWKGEK